MKKSDADFYYTPDAFFPLGDTGLEFLFQPGNPLNVFQVQFPRLCQGKRIGFPVEKRKTDIILQAF